MLAQMPDAGPWIGVIGTIIMWGGFIIVLGIFKTFITQGISFGTVEWLLKVGDRSTRSWICRHFSNEDQMMAYIDEMRERIGEVDTADKKSKKAA